MSGHVPTDREIAEFNAHEEAELRRLILPLCEKHGFGRVMQLVSRWWEERDPIGALTVGDAIGMLKRTKK